MDFNAIINRWQFEYDFERRNAMAFLTGSLPRKNHSPEFSQFWDDLLRFTIDQAFHFSLEDYKTKNYGSASEKLTLLFNNKDIWIKEDIYNLFLDYLVALLKIDLVQGKEFFNIFKEELGEDFTGTFRPLDRTIEYLESRDEEILEKLFPEEREVVEELAKRIETNHDKE